MTDESRDELCDQMYEVLISSPAWQGHCWAVEYPDFRECLEKARSYSSQCDRIEEFLNTYPESCAYDYNEDFLDELDTKAFELFEDIYKELEKEKERE